MDLSLLFGRGLWKYMECWAGKAFEFSVGFSVAAWKLLSRVQTIRAWLVRFQKKVWRVSQLLSGIFVLYFYEDHVERQETCSVVNSTGCSFRGPGLIPSAFLVAYNSTPSGPIALFWPSQELLHALVMNRHKSPLHTRKKKNSPKRSLLCFIGTNDAAWLELKKHSWLVREQQHWDKIISSSGSAHRSCGVRWDGEKLNLKLAADLGNVYESPT